MYPIRRALLALALALGALALGAAPAQAGHGTTTASGASLNAATGSNLFGASSLAVDGTSAPALKSIGKAAGLEPIPCEDGMAGPYPCENVDLESFLPLPALGGVTGNDIWGWTDPKTDRQYAIMGTSHTTGFVDVTDPQDPVLVGTLPTEGFPDFFLWRDVKVAGNYAFIVAEVSGSGLQVFDLTRLRGVTEPTVFDSDAHYTGFSWAHNVAINTETDFAYAVGSDECESADENGGLFMVDIRHPLKPRGAGCVVLETNAGVNNYVHDVECVVYDGPDPAYQDREICVGSNENIVAIYDVTDKDNPVVVSETGYPTAAYTHQGSLTENRKWFLFGDELDEGPAGFTPTVDNTTTYIMDVSDLDDPGAPIAYSHLSRSIDHNMYVHGERVFQSNYAEGLRILEFDDEMLAAGQLDEVAFFDVVPGVDAPEFAGTWSNYRFDDGTVVLSVIENEASGLFVLSPTLDDGDGGNGGGPGGATKPGKGCGDKNRAHERQDRCKKPAR